MELFFDIETIPDQTPGARNAFVDAAMENMESGEFKAPSGMTKGKALDELRPLYPEPEHAKLEALTKDQVIELWVENFKSRAGDERIAKAEEEGDKNWRLTALDGARGELAVIGFAFDREEPQAFTRNGPTAADEIALIQGFFDMLRQRLGTDGGTVTTPRMINHNIKGFDLPFVWKRAVIRNIVPPFNLQFKRFDDNIYCTMETWAGFGNRIKLEKLCNALGIESPKQNGLDGSKVWDFVSSGRIGEVADYCKEDVFATCNCYYRMTFAPIVERPQVAHNGENWMDSENDQPSE